MVVRALDHVPRCYSPSDGAIIADILRHAFSEGQKVVLSFDGVTDVPSSFVNAAFVSLLDEYPFETLKSQLTIIDATKQIADMIRRCLAIGVRNRQAA